jgi:hypothetical protein
MIYVQVTFGVKFEIVSWNCFENNVNNYVENQEVRNLLLNIQVSMSLKTINTYTWTVILLC